MNEKKKTKLTIMLLMVLLTAGCGTIVITNSLIYNISNLEDANNSNNPVLVTRTDKNGLHWTIFTSSYYGFMEFWVAFSKDNKNWSRPLYTGVPSHLNYLYGVEIDSLNNFVFYRYLRPQADKSYTRATIDTSNSTFIVRKSDLFYDLDADGLSDLGEYMLWTDPQKIDTDGDGKADGFDQNPLAAPPNDLTLPEQLHKYIIDHELEFFDTDQMVIVEQINNKAMEYEKTYGIILSMPPDTCDAFINLFGYGVPILTAAVRDTMNMYLVNFQYFIDPENAGGYDALFEWNHKHKEWERKKIYYQWEAGY